MPQPPLAARSPLTPARARRRLALCLGALLGLLWGLGLPAAALEWNAGDTARIRQGEIVVHETPVAEGGALVAGFFVAAPPAVCRRVLWDHEHFREFLPDSQGTRTLESGANRCVVEMIGGRGPFTVRYVTERTLEASAIRWHTLRGDVKRNDGAWRFTSAPGGTLVTYEVHVVPHQPVPGNVVALLQKQALPTLIRAVKQRCESVAGG